MFLYSQILKAEWVDAGKYLNLFNMFHVSDTACCMRENTGFISEAGFFV